MRHIIIVGGGLAAARTCSSLRSLGFDGRLTLLSAESRAPYDRPPLSKAALTGDIDSSLPFDSVALDVDLRLAEAVHALDSRRRTVSVDAGDLPFDGLVIATGADPIRLPGAGEQLTLRTAGDAAALRARLVPGAHLVIIGASWIGAEVATSALALGCRVSCVEAGSGPLVQALGSEVGDLLRHWWDGVDLRLGVGVSSVDPGGLRLADTTWLAADVVLTAVGVRPAIGWLASSGIELASGVVVDPHLRTNLPGVVAVGDVAAWWSARWQRRMRVLHWDDAAAAPQIAAAALLGRATEPHDPVPYFWSDQFGHKLQFAGMRSPTDQVVVRADGGAATGVAWLGPEGALSAYLAIDRPKDLLQARMAITAAARPQIDRLGDAQVPIRAA